MIGVNEANIAPGLLVSMPHLADPNFERSVVLMVEHNEQGSFGLIINKPSPMSVSRLLDALELTWSGDERQVVWSGGPVMPSSGWVLHSPSAVIGPGVSSLQEGIEGDGTVSITSVVDLSTSPAKLRLIAEQPPSLTRFILGYSGWGPGQLAAEMARGSWLHADVNADLVFNTPADMMWDSALRSVGIDPQQIIHSSGIN